MKKTEAESVKKISTTFLKEKNYFCGMRYGTITWTRNNWLGEEHKNRVSIQVSTAYKDKFLRIYYTQTDNNSGEKKDFDYRIPLVTTPCKFGGNRYWFICPMSKNGNYCGKRVGVLYKDGDYFACRHCYNITYASRNLSGLAKSFGSYLSNPELDELRSKIKRTHYKGIPTKKYRRFLEKDNRAEESFTGMSIAMLRKDYECKKVLRNNKK